MYFHGKARSSKLITLEMSCFVSTSVIRGFGFNDNSSLWKNSSDFTHLYFSVKTTQLHLCRIKCNLDAESKIIA